MISLIHPSRGRPKKAFNTAFKWIENVGCEIEYILSIDEDDSEREFYAMPPSLLGGSRKLIVRKNRSAIDAINNAAKICKGDIIIQMAEDFDCLENWGLKLIEETNGKTDWILKTQDGIQKWLITLPIMDRTYYNRFGYIYHPDYLHMFCDTELSCIADLTGRKLESNLLFAHNHYSTGKSEKDEISERADKTWEQGKAVFKKHYKENFGLKHEDVKGKIQDQNMINWINNNA